MNLSNQNHFLLISYAFLSFLFSFPIVVPQTVWPHRGVLTVSVKARCSTEVVSGAFGIFPENFCTKCLLWHVHVHFDCAGSHKTGVAGFASGIFPVNFQTKWLLRRVHVHFDCAGSHIHIHTIIIIIIINNIKLTLQVARGKTTTSFTLGFRGYPNLFKYPVISNNCPSYSYTVMTPSYELAYNCK